MSGSTGGTLRDLRPCCRGAVPPISADSRRDVGPGGRDAGPDDGAASRLDRGGTSRRPPVPRPEEQPHEHRLRHHHRRRPAGSAGDSDGRGPRVVVGVDGSPGARGALALALVEAARRGAALDVVTTYPVTLVWTGGVPVDIPDTAALRADTDRRARELVDEVRREEEQAGT